MSSPEPSTLWRQKLEELFGVDLRSLGLFRIALAAALLYDICDRASR